MRQNPARLLVCVAAVALLGAGCFNDAFRGHDFRSGVAADRFELLIEPDRTLVEGTHFLVDRATGDVWVLDVANGRQGAWVRLTDGPDDAQDLEIVLDVKKAEDADES